MSTNDQQQTMSTSQPSTSPSVPSPASSTTVKDSTSTSTTDTTTTSRTKTGSCLCGAITYTLAGASSTPHYSTICHCPNCQKASGSAFFSAMICPKEGFTITSNPHLMSTYLDKTTDSTLPLSRTFCSICGSNLFAFTPLRDEIVSVTAGTLDDFSLFVPDTEQYCGSRAGFVERVKGVEGGRRFVRGVRGEVE